MKHHVFTAAPEGFAPTLEVAGCYCEYQDTLLFLKRHSSRPEGNTWGVPAGKLEKGESPREAVIREVQEEIGVDVGSEDLQALGKLYIRLPHIDFVYHMFRKRLSTIPQLILSDEHVEARWTTLQEALNLSLITGGVDALSYYKKSIMQEK